MKKEKNSDRSISQEEACKAISGIIEDTENQKQQIEAVWIEIQKLIKKLNSTQEKYLTLDSYVENNLKTTDKNIILNVIARHIEECLKLCSAVLGDNKCSIQQASNNETGVDININWEIENPEISERD
jgi:enamine deaminase RidA (YjgF/YER057c/UK114 family)